MTVTYLKCLSSKVIQKQYNLDYKKSYDTVQIINKTAYDYLQLLFDKYLIEKQYEDNIFHVLSHQLHGFLKIYAYSEFDVSNT